MGAQYPSPRRWTKAQHYVELPDWLQERSRQAPKYYFHLREGDNYLRDEEGLQLCDLEAAKLEAMRGAKSILAAYRMLGTSCADGVIEVETEQGGRLFNLTLKQVQALDASSLRLTKVGARSK